VFANSPTLVTPALGTPSGLVGTNITGTATNFTASNVTTNANLTGDVTSVGNATTLTNAPVIAKVLTGYVSGAGTVAATDSILQAIQKLNGNDATNANLTGMVTSVGNATTVVTNANLTGAVTSSGNATSLGSFTSAQLLAALTDETGTGANVFATSPTLVTPALGTPSALVGTNITGTAANFNINGTVGATTPSTGNFTTLTENSIAVVTQSDIGTGANEIPLNQYLGSLAYQNGDAYYNTGMTVGFRNRIINGDMRIDQRNAGASVTPASGAYTLDRWQYGGSQASKVTIQQNAGSVTPPAGFKNYLGVVVASTATVGAGDYFQFSQKIEANNTSDFDWGLSTGKPLTLSFWAMCSGAVTLSGAVQSILSPYPSYPFTFSFTASGIWQQFVITIPAPPPSTNWDTGTSTSLYIQWNLAVGSTYSGPANAWFNSNYFGVTGASSLMGTVGNYLYITGVQLEKGNIATSFDVRPYGTELALCQRYCYKVTSAGGTDGYVRYVLGESLSVSSIEAVVSLPVQMRVTPSLTTPVATQFAAYTTGTIISLTTINIISGSAVNTAGIGASVATGLTAGRAVQVMSNNNNTSYLLFSSEL
jgi:hypothetical protein